VQEKSTEQARAGLGEIVERARLAGEPTLITRYGRPAAVVVSPGWYADALRRIGQPGALR
jgi:prevent-host-death family protein